MKQANIIGARIATGLFVGLLVLAVFQPVARGQRVVGRLDLRELGEDFRFDVNQIPVATTTNEQNSTNAIGFTAVDLNFSPNVIYSSSERAFVSVTGTDKVVVFNPKIPEILGTFTVPPNPALVTMTPDGTELAVVSLHLQANFPRQDSIDGDRIGAISLINVETLEVRTLNLEEVQFSFGNNIVFSPDGRSGFVASAGSNEIIRFDVASLTETGRLAVEPGSRPASATMAPDGSFFGVVLVGSTNLSRLDFPDAVAIIDTAAFSQTRLLVPDTGADTDDILLHNFVVYNNLAITPDGRFGVIAEQQASQVSLIPVLTFDRAYVFDLETGEQVSVVTVGGVAAGAYTMPNGEVVVMAASQISFLNIEEESTRTITPPTGGFRPTTRPAFVEDLMFVASPLSDAMLTIRPETGEIPRIVIVGGSFENELKVIVTSAPLDVSVTPDLEVLTAVNFNGDTLEFLKDTERIYFPRILGDGEFFTGVALTNNNPEAFDTILTGFQQNGLLFPSDGIELVFNGTFDSPQGWAAAAAGWTLENGVASASATDVSLTQDIFVVDGIEYVVSFTVSDYVGGTISIRLAGTDLTPRSANGTFTELVTAGAGGVPRLELVASGFTGNIDDVSVQRDIIKFENPLTFNVAGHTQVAMTETEWLQPTEPTQIEGWFDFDSDFELLGFEIIGDQDLRRMDGVVSQNKSGRRWILPEAIFDPPAPPNIIGGGSFDIVAVWNPGAGWVLGEGVATATEASSDLGQTVFVDAGVQYRVTYTIVEATAGTVTANLAGSAGTPRAEAGTFTEVIIAGDEGLDDDGVDGGVGDFRLTGDGFTGIVDDVIVTLDIDLPPPQGINTEITLTNPNRNRTTAVALLINDAGESVSAFNTALGGSGSFTAFVRDPNSNVVELVTNGAFGDESDWTTGEGWTIADGVASAEAAASSLSQDIEVVDGENYQVRFSILNYVEGSVSVRIAGSVGTARSADGTFAELIFAGSSGPPRLEVVATGFTGDIGFVSVRLATIDVIGMFPDQDLVGFESGYVMVFAAEGLATLERYFNNDRMSMLNGFCVDDPVETRFIVPQVVAFGDSQTFLTLINSRLALPEPEEPEEGDPPAEDPPAEDSEDIVVILSLFGDDGQLLAAPVERTLGPLERLREDLVQLFDLQPPAGGVVLAGWVEVVASQPGLVGSAEMQLFSQRAMTTVPIEARTSQELIFSHVVRGFGLLTGVALVNPGDESATVTLEVFRPDGELLGSATFEIGARGRRSQLIDEIIDDLPDLGGGFVRVTSDKPLVGLELFFAANTEFLATVSAQIPAAQ